MNRVITFLLQLFILFIEYNLLQDADSTLMRLGAALLMLVSACATLIVVAGYTGKYVKDD